MNANLRMFRGPLLLTTPSPLRKAGMGPSLRVPFRDPFQVNEINIGVGGGHCAEQM